MLSAAQQTRVKAEVDSISILIGQQAHLTLEVATQEQAHVVFPDFQPRQDLIDGIEILESSQIDTAYLDNGQMCFSRKYTITSFEDTLYAIPPIGVEVNGHSFSTSPIAFKVVTVEVDTLHLDQFFPPKDVQENPFLWTEWSGIFWLSILMVLLCALGIYLYMRLKENKPIIARIRIVKKILPHQKALKEIDKLKADRLLSSDNQKEYYTRLTDTLRKYIEERFGFSAMEMTTPEIIYHLQQSGDQTMIEELKDLFETADLVKFAKYSALINENDMNLVNAVNFIDQTKVEGLPTEERIAPKLSEDDMRIKQSRQAMKTMLYLIGIGVIILFGYIIYHVSMLLG